MRRYVTRIMSDTSQEVTGMRFGAAGPGGGVAMVEALIASKRKPDDRKDHAMASIAHAVFACNTGRPSRVPYSHPAHRQLT